MSHEPGSENTPQDGAEPVYGPAYTAKQTTNANAPAASEVLRGPAPPYTAPYPPYPSDVPYPMPIPLTIACGLAYLVAPAVLFLLLPAYRSHALLRFHSWQAIFYFILAVGLREVEQLLVSMLPSAVAFTISGLLLLALTAGWIVAAIKALQGEKWLMPLVGTYAEHTASTTSARG